LLTVRDCDECVEATLERVGRRVVLALPLGIGKPNRLANAFFRRALQDPSIDLTIVTALSLGRPTATSELERRFLEPIAERVFGSYVELDYAHALRAGRLPPNVRVIEFYLEPGAWLDVPHAQQHYLCANYTHVARDAMALGTNVIAQLVASRVVDGRRELSLGSNPDVTLDLVPLVRDARRGGREIALIGQEHVQMPFMLGAARVPEETFDLWIEEPETFDLFAPPNPALDLVDHAIGLHASSLIADGGTLQIGIGALGDSLAHALLLRHRHNSAWRGALAALGGADAALVERAGGREPFSQGLFASTEMLIDQMLDLYRAGILRRRAHDWLPLERLVASGRVGERVAPGVLEALREVGVGPGIDADTFERMRGAGILAAECRYDAGRIRSPQGEWIAADLGDPDARARLEAACLGRELQGGKLAHAGFFLGPRAFYAALRAMPEAELRLFDMRGVASINQLYGEDMELRILQRRRARFVNTAMMVTLWGAAVSDGLADGRVVSGVGGQYNFVAMAHALPDARSILCVRATRTKAGRVTSNVVASYGHTTIPRHLRDVVVTEYGIADLRGKTDREVAAALLAVADSRFQPQLLAAAKAAGKLERGYEIPLERRANVPERLARAFAAHRDHFPPYPFGTDLTDVEVELAGALQRLAARRRGLAGGVRALLRAWRGAPAARHAPHLERIGLTQPRGLGERLLARLVCAELDLARRAGAAEDPQES
jgi:acyl-CoA hydrolase